MLSRAPLIARLILYLYFRQGFDEKEFNRAPLDTLHEHKTRHGIRIQMDTKYEACDNVRPMIRKALLLDLNRTSHRRLVLRKSKADARGRAGDDKKV
jgi:hypothetical protein